VDVKVNMPISQEIIFCLRATFAQCPEAEQYVIS
jgi:hypothetical protein